MMAAWWRLASLPFLRESFLKRMLAGDGVALGETQIWVSPDQTMATHGAVLSLWGIIFGAVTG
jgi:hypothetical protein